MIGNNNRRRSRNFSISLGRSRAKIAAPQQCYNALHLLFLICYLRVARDFFNCACCVRTSRRYFCVSRRHSTSRCGFLLLLPAATAASSRGRLLPSSPAACLTLACRTSATALRTTSLPESTGLGGGREKRGAPALRWWCRNKDFPPYTMCLPLFFLGVASREI
jgi:hypothetical protein